MPLSDTSPDVQRVLVEVYRRLTPAQKWLQLGEMYRDLRLLHAAGLRLRRPHASPREIVRDWISSQLGLTVPAFPGEPAMDAMTLGLNDLREVLRCFEE